MGWKARESYKKMGGRDRTTEESERDKVVGEGRSSEKGRETSWVQE